MSKGELRVRAGISTRQLAKLGKNENVTTDVLVKVCRALDCNIDEIMDIAEAIKEI
jgi:DNA-binding Xre family transcriptional regulator